jgi:hypothetical protein
VGARYIKNFILIVVIVIAVVALMIKKTNFGALAELMFIGIFENSDPEGWICAVMRAL